ncbi:MAG: DUF481 domain-containing protein [Sulfurovum sp.]|nr:DUF481 domain-containing protein [Sulfurovum sp.]MCB4761650.1 DUF481 domain-containing protein [Sulfurovum sp.]MCB4772283.1 DUF481 domain-containing protein [Sulfurovum sp.]
MFKKLTLLTVTFCSFSYGFVSLEPPEIGKKRGFAGEVSVGGTFNSGNTNSIAMHLELKTEYHKQFWMLYSLALSAYGETNDNTNKNNGLFHLRYIHNIQKTPYDYELFVQTESNKFQSVNVRNIAGANIRRKITNFFDTCYIGLGLFYSYMEPNTITLLNPLYKRTKINTYLSFTKNLNEHVSVTYLGFYQPNMEEFLDYRIFEVLQLDTTLTKNLFLGLDINHKYNATPYHNIKKTDISSIISLKYKFK